jgi:hypothetical protein
MERIADSSIIPQCIPNRRTPMPAKSKAQQKAAGAALAAKRGETPKTSLKGASREMYDSMTKSELKEFASTSRKKLPDKKNPDKKKKAKKKN